MRGLGARQPEDSAGGGNARALFHLGLDRPGFGDGIERQAGIQFDEPAGLIVAQGFPRLDGDRRQLRPLRQQPVPQAGEDFVTGWDGSRQRAHRHRIDEADSAGQGDGLGRWPR
ncbi:MAG: hypothetical protein EA420_09080 [Candidatus Competibacteraceae bacterium]|nr:MAG: hypothetical protein EA420_09080 [Candidatus Competibacteraceae bacterium]